MKASHIDTCLTIIKKNGHCNRPYKHCIKETCPLPNVCTSIPEVIKAQAMHYLINAVGKEETQALLVEMLV